MTTRALQMRAGARHLRRPSAASHRSPAQASRR